MLTLKERLIYELTSHLLFTKLYINILIITVQNQTGCLLSLVQLSRNYINRLYTNSQDYIYKNVYRVDDKKEGRMTKLAGS